MLHAFGMIRFTRAAWPGIIRTMRERLLFTEVGSQMVYPPGTDAVRAAGAAGSTADLFSINNCPATNITAANAIANIAVAS